MYTLRLPAAPETHERQFAVPLLPFERQELQVGATVVVDHPDLDPTARQRRANLIAVDDTLAVGTFEYLDSH